MIAEDEVGPFWRRYRHALLHGCPGCRGLLCYLERNDGCLDIQCVAQPWACGWSSVAPRRVAESVRNGWHEDFREWLRGQCGDASLPVPLPRPPRVNLLANRAPVSSLHRFDAARYMPELYGRERIERWVRRIQECGGIG